MGTRISLLDFAKFANGNESSQKAIIGQYLPKKQGEFKALHYHREARQTMKIFHNHRMSEEWLREEAYSLLAKVEVAKSKQSLARIKSNHKALINYLYSDLRKKDINILPSKYIKLSLNGLMVSGMYDIRIIDHGKQGLVKIDYVKHIPKQEVIQTIISCLFWGYHANRLLFDSCYYRYWNLSSGREFGENDIDIMPLSQLENIAKQILLAMDIALESRDK